jgi:hypothetical protein
MKIFFKIVNDFHNDSFKLLIDYSIDEVQDTLLLTKPGKTPSGFLNLFNYKKIGGSLFQDMLANNMGWKIFSSRVWKTLASCQNAQDLELHPLPSKVVDLFPQLHDYRVLGLKREIPCVDFEKSEITWFESKNGIRGISSFKLCVLREAALDDDLDVFLIQEYPVMTIISGRLGYEISKLYPTGFVYERIEAL